MRNPPFAAAFALACLAGWRPAPAGAGEFMTRLFGHDVMIFGKQGEQRLKADGRELTGNYSLSVDEIGLVGGIPVAVGTSWAGGNACEGAPFDLSFPPGGQPKLDGPLDSCAAVEVVFEADRLALSTEAIPGTDGETWTWTPASGFARGGMTSFAPDAGKGWAELAKRRADHPGDLLALGEIAGRIEAMAGADKPLVQRALAGVGSGRFDGDWFVGSACTPHMCDLEAAMIAASLPNRRLYLAWKPPRRRIAVEPPVREWPEKARAALRAWAEQWK